ncbi:hypothetical protein [Citrifermentans bremense]|uniref:hypothetical protein n=1 Tax=Citrifermentans bremense TaxID=60035 RepID=UPI0004057E86|nr:hypothetical protein [Citrifermentans bremense]
MENKSNGMRKGMGYLGNALKVTLGAGVALGGAYLVSRVSEKQDTEASLSRLEQMLSELATSDEPEKRVAKRRRT